MVYWVLERNSIPYTMYGCSLFNVSWQWCSCLCIVNYYDYANDFAMLLNFENDWLLWECFQSIKHMPDWSGFLANFYLLGFKKFLGGFFFQYTFRSSLIFFLVTTFSWGITRAAWMAECRRVLSNDDGAASSSNGLLQIMHLYKSLS